ncbi:MAG TPA: TolC family protein [Phycisphaerae bacterium]|nr:TolC family protein [Phycisphaerae bacterium]
MEIDRRPGGLCRACFTVLTVWLVGGCASGGGRMAVRQAVGDAPADAPPARFDVAEQHTEPQPPVLDESADLSDYLTCAALNNPGLEAAFHRWKAALERVPQVTALPDPRFSYRYFIEEVETRVGPQQQAFGLSQTFPWLGKLQLRGDVAAQEAEAVRQRYEAEKLALFYRVKDAYYEYYYLGRAIAVVRKNRDLLEDLEQVVRAEYKTGEAGYSEVIRAQVELEKLEDSLRALVDLRGPIVARLNAALNRPAHADLPFPQDAPQERIDAGDKEILAWADEANPELKALDHEIAQRRSAVDLAGLACVPDFTVGVDYTDVGSAVRPRGAGLRNPAALRSLSRFAGGMGDPLDVYAIGNSFLSGSAPDDAGKDVWAVSVSMNVPIWYGKYAAGQREARARHLAAMAEKSERRNALAARIKMALYQLRDADRKIDLYRDTLLAKARQALESTEAAFRAGKAGFLDLVDAERTLLDFELSYERALAGKAQRLAEVEMLVGRTIPRRQQTEAESQTTGEAQGRPQDGS